MAVLECSTTLMLSDDIIQLQEQLEYSRYFTKSLLDSLHEMAASASL